MNGYVFLHIKRNVVDSLLTTVLAATLTFIFLLLFSTRERLEKNLDTAYSNFVIYCTVAGANGIKTDGLVLVAPLRYLTGAEYELNDYIKDLFLKVTLKATLSNNCSINLIGINSKESDSMLSPEYGVQINFLSGYGWEHMQGKEPIAIVSRQLLESNNIKLGDTISIKVEGSVLVADFNVISPEYTNYLVVGSLDYGPNNSIYCPYWYAYSFLDVGFSESISFSLNNNRELEAFRSIANKYFIEPDASIQNGDFGPFSLHIDDTLYYETISQVKRDIKLFTALIPLACVMCATIGFVFGLIKSRLRKREVAVMRSLGTPKAKVLWMLLSEQFLLILLGSIIGTIISIAARYTTNIAYAILISIICFIVGSALSICRIAYSNIISIIKEKE